MNPNLIAATLLFGPAAVACPAAVIAWWRHRGDLDAALAACATMPTQPDQAPPDGGMPEPAHVADVIPFPTRHAA